MSGIPRMFEFGPGAPADDPTNVLPGGSVLWYEGLGNRMLYPPPVSIQPISRTPGNCPHVGGGEALSTVVPVEVSVQRYVPPTAVTSGSDAGQPTLGYGIVPGFFTGSLNGFAVPKSPVEASTVTCFCWASTYTWRSWSSAAVPPLNVA